MFHVLSSVPLPVILQRTQLPECLDPGGMTKSTSASVTKSGVGGGRNSILTNLNFLPLLSFGKISSTCSPSIVGAFVKGTGFLLNAESSVKVRPAAIHAELGALVLISGLPKCSFSESSWNPSSNCKIIQCAPS